MLKRRKFLGIAGALAALPFVGKAKAEAEPPPKGLLVVDTEGKKITGHGEYTTRELYAALGSLWDPDVPRPVITYTCGEDTLEQQKQIQHDAYAGGVTISFTDGVGGTVFPAGTPMHPVNNLKDAMAIAHERKIYERFFK